MYIFQQNQIFLFWRQIVKPTNQIKIKRGNWSIGRLLSDKEIFDAKVLQSGECIIVVSRFEYYNSSYVLLEIEGHIIGICEEFLKDLLICK